MEVQQHPAVVGGRGLSVSLGFCCLGHIDLAACRFNSSQGAFAEVPLSTNGTDTVWGSRGSWTWNVQDAFSTPGVGADWMQLNGALAITANSSSPFTLNVTSTALDGNPGPAAHFSKSLNYHWTLVTASGGITGFDPGNVRLRTTDFAGDLGGGTFSIALTGDGQSLDLLFLPNSPPAAFPAHYVRPLEGPFRINIADLLATSTSDPNGDSVALVQISGSTNNSSMSSDGTTLVFVPHNRLPETFTYWVQDVREYRPGDTVGVASSTITIEPEIDGLPELFSYHAIELQWQTEGGKKYQLQARLGSDGEWLNTGNVISGTGEKVSIFERAGELTKFYRLLLVE